MTIWSMYKETEEEQQVYKKKVTEERLVAKRSESFVSHSSIISNKLSTSGLPKVDIVPEDMDESSSHSSYGHEEEEKRAK